MKVVIFCVSLGPIIFSGFRTSFVDNNSFNQPFHPYLPQLPPPSEKKYKSCTEDDSKK